MFGAGHGELYRARLRMAHSFNRVGNAPRVTASGLPPDYPDQSSMITDDCITPTDGTAIPRMSDGRDSYPWNGDAIRGDHLR